MRVACLYSLLYPHPHISPNHHPLAPLTCTDRHLYNPCRNSPTFHPCTSCSSVKKGATHAWQIPENMDSSIQLSRSPVSSIAGSEFSSRMLTVNSLESESGTAGLLLAWDTKRSAPNNSNALGRACNCRVQV